MAQQYCRTLLRVAVAQICQNFGWSSAQSSSLEVLTDVLEKYLMQLGGTCSKYTQHYGRKQPNLDDVALAFEQMGISVAELEDYVRHVEPVPFAHEVVAFPAPKSTDLGFPNPRSREILHHREEHIPEYMPYMFPNMKDEIPEEKATPAVNGIETPVKSEEVSENNDKEEPAVGEKRAATSTIPEMPPSKRPRFGNSNLPEEAGHSQYEMSCVFMGPNGVLTTRQGCVGRLPEPCMPPPNPRSLNAGANKENSGKTKDTTSATKISISVGGIGADGSATGKSEGKKSKKPVHKKTSLHDQTAKSGAEISGKEFGKKSASSKAAAKFLKKLKQSKKSGKLFTKSKSKDQKSTEYLRNEESVNEKVKMTSDIDQGKKKKETKPKPLDSDEELRKLSSPSSSREASPEHSIINDGEGGAKKKARLEAISDSINAVLRDGPLKESKGKKKKKKDEKLEDSSSKGDTAEKSTSSGKTQEPKVKRKPGRPPKVQKAPEPPPPPVDIKPFVSDKYSSAELQVYEFNDSPPDASVKSRRPSAADTVQSPPPPPPVKQEHHPKHSGSSHRLTRRFEPEDDLFTPDIKIESHVETSDTKTSKLDSNKDKDKSKTAKDEKKVRSKDDKGVRKGKDDKDHHKDKKEKHKEENEVSKDEKEKHKDKEHKKDKKERKKEKEKKKKHKEKDRDKEKDKKREEKVKQETRESRESSPAPGLGVKLKIKIGGSAGPSTSMMVTGESNPASPASTGGSKRESMSPPRIVPKLYISKKGQGQEEKTKKGGKQSQQGESKRKTSPLAISTKSQSTSPSSSSKTSPSPRSTPTPPVPRKTPTPPPHSKQSSKDSHSPHNKDSSTNRQKSSSPAPPKERQSRPVVKGGRKVKKKERKRSLSSLSSTSSSSSLSPSKPANSRAQTPPKLQRASPSSPEKSPPSLPFQSASVSPKAPSRATRSPSYTSPPRSPTPPALSRQKVTPPPALSPVNSRRQQSQSRSPSPVKPPTPGSTSPPPSPDWNLPLSPSHHRSPTPTPRTPTASPSRNIMPSPTHSPVSSPIRRSPSPVVQQTSRPSSRLLTTPEPKSHPSPASSGKSSSSTSKPARTVEAETVCVFIDEAGQKVWICPACKLPDDGSEMIGCDMCDNWYHWPCVGINEAPPEEQQWFCSKCLPKTKSSTRGRGRPRGRGRGRGRKKIT